MSPAGKRIFVSYSHKDHEDSTVVGKIFTHLYGLKQSFTELEIWIDQKMIRVGDQWLPEIEGACAWCPSCSRRASGRAGCPPRRSAARRPLALGDLRQGSVRGRPSPQAGD